MPSYLTSSAGDQAGPSVPKFRRISTKNLVNDRLKDSRRWAPLSPTFVTNSPLFIVLLSVTFTALIFHALVGTTGSSSSPSLSLSRVFNGDRRLNSKVGSTLTKHVQPQRLTVVTRKIVRRRKILNYVNAHDHDGTHPDFKRLLVYNRPPIPASLYVSRALAKAINAKGMRSSRCFASTETNAMSLKTAINRNHVDLYNCQLQLSKARYRDVQSMRGNNVTFLSSTVDPITTLISAYLQQAFGSFKLDTIQSVSDQTAIKRHSKQFQQFVDRYPVGRIYDFHGADEDFPLTECPTRYEQLASLRRVVARYEIIIDLEKPVESATLVDIVTDGAVKPDFTSASSHPQSLRDPQFRQSPLVAALMKQNVTHKICGLQLVHNLLTQQFNLIKDRLMQNRCFDEDKGTFRLCDFMPLRKEEVKERNRDESFAVKDELAEKLKRSSTMM